jgi:hypothetical protein
VRSGRTVDEVWTRIHDAEVPYDNLPLGQFLEKIGVRSVEESLVPPGFAGSLAAQPLQGGHPLPPPMQRHEVHQTYCVRHWAHLTLTQEPALVTHPSLEHCLMHCKVVRNMTQRQGTPSCCDCAFFPCSCSSSRTPGTCCRT